MSAPSSSIGIKYKNITPFEYNKENKTYNLYNLENASGTYEAFGGWGLDEIMDLHSSSKQYPCR